MQWEGFII